MPPKVTTAPVTAVSTASQAEAVSIGSALMPAKTTTPGPVPVAVSVSIMSLQLVADVADDRIQHRQRVRHPARGAGQVHDERAPGGAGEAARERRMRGAGQ